MGSQYKEDKTGVMWVALLDLANSLASGPFVQRGLAEAGEKGIAVV